LSDLYLIRTLFLVLAFLISSWAIYNYKSLSFLVSDEWEESILRILSKSISPSFDSNSSVYLD
jgi:hypothetical protein